MGKAKNVMVSLTQEHIDKAKKDSVKVFGKINLSGYIQYLIQKNGKYSACGIVANGFTFRT